MGYLQRPALIGQPLVHSELVTSVSFSPDGKTILTGSPDNTARAVGRRHRRAGGANPGRTLAWVIVRRCSARTARRS